MQSFHQQPEIETRRSAANTDYAHVTSSGSSERPLESERAARSARSRLDHFYFKLKIKMVKGASRDHSKHVAAWADVPKSNSIVERATIIQT
jgi:hypothetical protein